MPGDVVRLRLYVAANAPNSNEALQNLETLCRTHLAGRHTIEIIDVFTQPQRALDDGVLLTPTLLVLTGDRPKLVVGTLSHAAVVLRALGVQSQTV